MIHLAELLAALISGGTRAVLAVLSWRPPLWARIATPVVIIAAAYLLVRWHGRPAKLGRPPRRRLLRPVDQRQRDGER